MRHSLRASNKVNYAVEELESQQWDSRTKAAEELESQQSDSSSYDYLSDVAAMSCLDSFKVDYETRLEEIRQLQLYSIKKENEERKRANLLASVKRIFTYIRKESQVYIHKVHLLCWIAHGNLVNSAINNDEILALALSLLPLDKCHPPDRTNLTYLEQIVQWFNKAVRLKEKLVPEQIDLVDSLKSQIGKKEAHSKKMLVCIFVAILRALGIQCRLVLSFQVELINPPVSGLSWKKRRKIKKWKKEANNKNVSTESHKDEGDKEKTDLSKRTPKVNVEKGTRKTQKQQQNRNTKKNRTKRNPQVEDMYSSEEDDFFIPQLDGACDKNKRNRSIKQTSSSNVRNRPIQLKSINSKNDPHVDLTKSPKFNKTLKVHLHRLKDIHKKSDELTKTFVTLPKKQLYVKVDRMNSMEEIISKQKLADESRRAKKRNVPSNNNDSDSDFMPQPAKMKRDSERDNSAQKSKVKKGGVRGKKTDLKTSSNDSKPEKTGRKSDNYVWAEVFLESEEKWISIEVVVTQLHCFTTLLNRPSHPVSYMVAWNNNNNVKDVTRRYCRDFDTIMCKHRIDSKWWDESLKPFFGEYTAKDKKEDEDLDRQQRDQPLPKTVSEYKNHPLYALKRHLLKYEALYPPDVQSVGHIKGEAVYPRKCVYMCRSANMWFREAKVIKPGEEPYKIIAYKPKYTRFLRKPITNQQKTFGPWQTTDYEPPTATGGKVPRNKFGYVDLFKPCMLPKGTVHLRLPFITDVCFKMKIDCASAVVGFDFYTQYSEPQFDGFVICEEFADSVRAACKLEYENYEKRKKEEKEKRIYKNWKRFINGLLLRERANVVQLWLSQKHKERKKICTKTK